MKLTISFSIELDGKRPDLLTRLSWRRRRDQIKKRDAATCKYCGEHAPGGQVDHIVPLSCGGTDDLNNLVWACQACNASKGNRTVDEWINPPLPKITRLKRTPELDRLGERIRQLHAEGLSKRQIQMEVFGYTGGKAFDVVSAALKGGTTTVDEALNSEIVIEHLSGREGEMVDL